MPETPEARLAAFIAGSSSQSITAVVEKATHCLLDSYGLARQARDNSVVTAVRRLAQEAWEGSTVATAWTDGSTLPLFDAIMVNSVAAHAHFQDDTDMTAWAHPGSIIPPVALGVAEATGATLDVALRGLMVGYAALHWLGADERVPKAANARGFRIGPILGAIAAAAAAAAVLALDEQAVRNALAISATGVGASLQPIAEASEEWRLQYALSAVAGTRAALLAQQGVRGATSPLTGRFGLLATVAGITEPEEWTTPPTIDAIKQVWFKRYPTLGDNMAAVVTAAHLHEQLGDGDVPATVHIRMNEVYASYPGTQYLGPFETTEQMIGSVAFGVATLLLHGDLEYSDYDRLRTDSRVADLVSRTVIAGAGGYGYLDADVAVTTDGGEALTVQAAELNQTVFFRDRAASVERFIARGGDETAAHALYAAATDSPDSPAHTALTRLAAEFGGRR